MSKFPLAFVFAIAASLFTTFTLYGLLIPYAGAAYIGEYIVQVTSLKWMAIIAAVLFFFFYGLFGLLINIIALIGKIFASTPLLVIIGIAAIAVGILVIAAPSLVINPFIDPWPLPTVP